MMAHRASLFCLLLLLFTQLVLMATPPSHRTYALSQRVQGSQVAITIYERNSHHVAWRGTFPKCESVTWSRNQQAVFFIIHDRQYILQKYYPLRVAVWRVGFGIREIDLYGDDYILPWSNGQDFIWSPDAYAFLYRIGGGGEYTEDSAPLFCMNISTRKMYEIAQFVQTAYWLGRNVVKYQQYVPLWADPVPKGSDHPHLWHRPSH